MFDLLSIGNIAIDLYFKGDSLTEKEKRFALAIGGKYQVDFFKESLGGGAANVAVGVSRHGFNTAVIGLVGENPFKQIIIQHLSRRMVSTELLITLKDYLNISTIILNKAGERSIIHYSTPDVSLNLTDSYFERIKKVKSVYLGNTPGITLEEKLSLAKFIKKNNIILFLNLSGADCRNKTKKTEELISLADVFILNTHEFCELTKTKYSPEIFKKDVSKKLTYFKKLLVVTDAENGSYAYLDSKVYYHKAYKPRVILDTTGAGDAYTAGFISEYLSSQNIDNAIKNGSLYASKIIERVSAQ